ncbi:MAG: beta-lactamase family protein [Marinicaulis sp.]|nr:beta-lactamase family protein [Marinicaulis sp.]
MKAFKDFAFALGVLAVSTGAAAQAPDPSPTTPVETLELAAFEPTRDEAVLEAYIDGVVDAHRREHGTPGVTVSVVQNGKVLFAKGYGYADLDAETPVSGNDTLFRIGSVSKTFTWAAVMMLAERGAIDLDADVNQYLKGIQIPEAFDAPVTMNHLMAHRAGFEETFGVFTHKDDTDVSLTDALIADMPARINPPGARSSYSNWGAALAAKIVEDVTGENYETFLSREILAPLAMSKTTLHGPLTAPANLQPLYALGYGKSGGGFAQKDPMQIGPFAPAGAMGSTAADMAQWMLLLLGKGEHNGNRLYSPETADEMFSRAFGDRPRVSDVAHGFFTKTYKGYDVYGHGGGTANFRTYMEVNPALDVGIFISQNSIADAALIGQLPDIITARLAGDAAPRETAARLTAKEAAEYAGAYVTNRRSFVRFEKLFSISATATVAPGANGTLAIQSPNGPREMRRLGGDVFEDRNGNRVAFDRGTSGAVTHFSSGPQSYERVGFFGGPNSINAGFGLAAFFAATTLGGAWRRQGRNVPQTGVGRGLGVFAIVAALCAIALVAMIVIVVATLSNYGAADLLNYPPAQIVWLRLIAMAAFIVAGLGVLSLAPVWLKSGWSIWRKLHHTMFAGAMALLGAVLVIWNIIFAPIS